MYSGYYSFVKYVFVKSFSQSVACPFILFNKVLGFPGGLEVKASASSAGDLGSIPGSGRSPGEGNGNPLQYSCLENPVDRGAWWATVHGVAKSWTRLSDFTFFSFLSSQSKRDPLVAQSVKSLSAVQET